jgi:hypothetical protein
MSDPREWRYLIVSMLALVVVVTAWGLGWAVREARDVDPMPMALLSTCLEDERGLRLVSPSGDPLADSAPHGALRTTIDGNDVTVSIWSDHDAALETLQTYARLTPENLEGRAVARGRLANLWAAPPTGGQASALYRCEP